MEQPTHHDRPPPPANTVINGNCIGVMNRMPPGSVDFILTDPPYIVRYTGRQGRTVPNDDNSTWLNPAFAAMHRVLKPDACAVSFYGWAKAGLFLNAWKRTGFRIAGHIVFRKGYASNTGFLQYRHEPAYLLVKGNPPRPAEPPPDVLEWTYTGNTLHPTQKPVSILKPLIAAFTQPGQLVLDPFAGSGSTLAAARLLSRDYIGIDIDPQHCRTAHNRMVALNARRAA